MIRRGTALGAFVFLGWLGVTPAARADSIETRRTDARAIARGDGSARLEAIDRTCNLPPSSIPVIRERIAEIRSRMRPTSDSGYLALGEFAVAAGGTGPADPRDLLSGIRAFPADRFTAAHANAAERYCLIRSLERAGTAEALVAALPLVTFDIRALRWQARHLVRRNGRRSVAMLIRARAFQNPEVALWSGWGLVELGIRDSGGSVQEQSEESLAAVLLAYPAANHLGGMPVVASFVDDPRPSIREAARRGLAAYGDNAVWELRRLHQTRLGRDPGAQPAASLLRSLSQELDRRRDAPLRERAEAALTHTDDATARRLADVLIADAPVSPATATLAPLLVRQATVDAEAGRLEAARSRLAIAKRLGASGDATRELDEALERARLEARGIVESTAEAAIELPTTDGSTLARRRAIARFGFGGAFLLLGGPTLAIVLGVLGRRLARAMRDATTALARAWAEGGREKASAVLAAAIAAARAGMELLRSRVARLASVAPTSGTVDAAAATIDPRVRTAAPVPPPASERRAEPEVATPRVLTPNEARRPLALPVTEAARPLPRAEPEHESPRRVPRAEPESAPLAPSPVKRRERPTRRAAASVDLFTSTPVKRHKSA